jgi:hypothetical protein
VASTDTPKQTDTTVLRIVNRDTGFDPSLELMWQQIRDVHSLLVVGGLLAKYEERPFRIWPLDVLDEPTRIADSFRIGRLTYSSPLEILLYVSASSGLVVYACRQVLKLFNETLDTRKHASDVSVQTTMNRLIKKRLNFEEAQLEIYMKGSDKSGERVVQRAEPLGVGEKIEEAAWALERVERIELEQKTAER